MKSDSPNKEATGLDPGAPATDSGDIEPGGSDPRLNSTVRFLAVAAIAVGILLRLRAFLFARPLWGDEAALAINLVHLPVESIIRPLANGQMAPVGFLLLEKVAILLFGTSEQALRLVPFLAGVATLLLLFPIARRYAGDRAAVLATWFGALTQPLAYYANELKQYSSDVTVALLILLLAQRAARPKPRTADWALFAAVGAVAVWFSHPAALVLAGAGIVLLVAHLRSGNRAAAYSAVGAATLWLASFAVLYAVLLHQQVAAPHMQEYWSRAFMPFPPASIGDVTWFSESFYRFFEDPMGLRAAGMAAVLLAVGAAAWTRHEPPRLLALLLVPVFLSATVSAGGLYPFEGRLLLYLVPGLLIVIARGLIAAFDVSRAVGMLLTTTLLITPVFDSITELQSPLVRQDLRSVLERIEANSAPGDSFVLSYNAVSKYRYYRFRGTTTIDAYQVFGGWDGLPSWNREAMDHFADLIPGEGRFWVITTTSTLTDAAIEEALLFRRAEDFGRETIRFDAVGARAVLFTLADEAAGGDAHQ